MRLASTLHLYIDTTNVVSNIGAGIGSRRSHWLVSTGSGFGIVCLTVSDCDCGFRVFSPFPIGINNVPEFGSEFGISFSQTLFRIVNVNSETEQLPINCLRSCQFIASNATNFDCDFSHHIPPYLSIDLAQRRLISRS
jgi:hypothetical protein